VQRVGPFLKYSGNKWLGAFARCGVAYVVGAFSAGYSPDSVGLEGQDVYSTQSDPCAAYSGQLDCMIVNLCFCAFMLICLKPFLI